jgi:hypothetical protein
MTPFEEAVVGELAALLRAGVPGRGVRLTVRELVVARLERGPLGAREVGDIVEGTVRAAFRLARELSAPDEVVETVCRGALEAVRGHGGESARWLGEATTVVSVVLEELARDHAEEPTWRWLTGRAPRW